MVRWGKVGRTLPAIGLVAGLGLVAWVAVSAILSVRSGLSESERVTSTTQAAVEETSPFEVLPTEEVAIATRDYLATQPLVFEVFRLITDDLHEVRDNKEFLDTSRCEEIATRLFETVGTVELLGATILIPDEVLVELHTNFQASRVAALEACLVGNGSEFATYWDESGRISELISVRMSLVGAGTAADA